MDPGQGRRGVGYVLDHLAAQHHGEALLAQVRVRDVVDDETQVRVHRCEAPRVVTMSIVEVGCHHFAVKFREYRQVDARTEADLERTARTLPRAGSEFAANPVAACAMKPSPRWISGVVERLQQWQQFRFSAHARTFVARPAIAPRFGPDRMDPPAAI